MNSNEIWKVALKKQLISIKLNPKESFYKTDEYLLMMIEDVVKNSQTSEYFLNLCRTRVKNTAKQT